MRICWISDIHLDHLIEYFVSGRKQDISLFLSKIKSLGPDVVVCTGDITNGLYLQEDLEQLVTELHPIKFYFVLGNHDYWKSNIQLTRKKLREGKFCNNWLTSAGIVPIVPDKICLIGSDGWYDGRLGKFFLDGGIEMNDWYYISDFDECLDKTTDTIDRRKIWTVINTLAEESSLQIKQQAELAIQNGYGTVIVATHVPPFAENALNYPYGKKKPSTRPEKSSIYNLPCYSSKTMGDVLTELAEKNPEVMFNVFCGHAHADATVKHFPNLVCSTAFSAYKHPERSIKIIEVAD